MECLPCFPLLHQGHLVTHSSSLSFSMPPPAFATPHSCPLFHVKFSLFLPIPRASDLSFRSFYCARPLSLLMLALHSQSQHTNCFAYHSDALIPYAFTPRRAPFPRAFSTSSPAPTEVPASAFRTTRGECFSWPPPPQWTPSIVRSARPVP
jgi:hypothetical protein